MELSLSKGILGKGYCDISWNDQALWQVRAAADLRNHCTSILNVGRLLHLLPPLSSGNWLFAALFILLLQPPKKIGCSPPQVKYLRKVIQWLSVV